MCVSVARFGPLTGLLEDSQSEGRNAASPQGETARHGGRAPNAGTRPAFLAPIADLHGEGPVAGGAKIRIPDAKTSGENRRLVAGIWAVRGPPEGRFSCRATPDRASTQFRARSPQIEVSDGRSEPVRRAYPLGARFAGPRRAWQSGPFPGVPFVSDLGVPAVIQAGGRVLLVSPTLFLGSDAAHSVQTR